MIKTLLQTIFKCLILLFRKGKRAIHSTSFWHHKALVLLEENRLLRKQLQETLQSREIADKVFIESKTKMEELKYQLELYEECLAERREELQRREALLCTCKRIPTRVPIFEFDYDSGESNWEDDIPIGIL